jgi:hypothetical protein
MTTYTVYQNGKEPHEPMGLSPEQVMRYIYTYGDSDFRLVPGIEAELDKEDGYYHLLQPEVNGFKEWNVHFNFKFGDKFLWCDSQYVAYGNTRDEAEGNYLAESWERFRWDKNTWTVVSDNEFNRALGKPTDAYANT